MSNCNNCGSSKNQYTDYGSYLRTRGNNVDINKFIYDIGFGNFRFENLKTSDTLMNHSSNHDMPTVIILNDLGEMRTVSTSNVAASNTYTLELQVDASSKRTFVWKKK